MTYLLAAAASAVVLIIGLVLASTLPRDDPHVPDDVVERIDATLPRSQSHAKWAANREDMRQ